METENKYNTEDPFIEAVKSKLQHYSAPVEDNSWAEIEQQLNDHRGKKIPLWAWVSGLSVAASIALICYFSFTQQPIQQHIYETVTELPANEETVIENLLEEKDFQPPVAQKNRRPRISKNVHPSGDHVIFAEIEIPERMEKESISPEKEEQHIPKHPLENVLEGRLSCCMRKKQTTLGLYAGSGRNLYAMNDNSFYRDKINSELAGDGIVKAPATAFAANELLAAENFDKIVHHPPVSIGISVRKELNNYLSIESGLVYSYLQSEYESKIPHQDAKLELHYLGIPLNLVVNLYGNSYSSWNIYVLAGGMVEKGLLSHYKHNSYEQDMTITTTSNEKIEGLQGSLQAALGVDYKISRDYSVYIEPKLTYYLDNNQPFSVRTEHPFTPGINAGIRFTW